MSNATRNGNHSHTGGYRLLAGSLRVYRVLLLAYPRAFRGEFGEELAQVFRTACREVMRQGGAAALLRFWGVMLVDLAVAAAAERLKEGFSMSRSNVARLGGIALLVASVAQIVFIAVQAAITLDFAIAYTAPTGSPWIGRGEAAVSLAPTLALLVLLGMIGLHALGRTRTGAMGWVAITLIAVGLVVQVVAGMLASALSWGDLSACISARNCNIYDGTGMFRQAIAVEMAGNLIATLGLVIYGILMLRVRLLPRGNVLLLLLVVVSALPYLILRVAIALVPATDAEGEIRLGVVGICGSLAVAIVTFLLGSAILGAASQLPPADAAGTAADTVAA